MPGKVDLAWDRMYSTMSLDRGATAMGLGWTCRYLATLARTTEGYRFVTPEGDVTLFSDPEDVVARGGVVRQLGTFEEIYRFQNRFIVQRWDIYLGEVWRYCFTPG